MPIFLVLKCYQIRETFIVITNEVLLIRSYEDIEQQMIIIIIFYIIVSF